MSVVINLSLLSWQLAFACVCIKNSPVNRLFRRLECYYQPNQGFEASGRSSGDCMLFVESKSFTCCLYHSPFPSIWLVECTVVEFTSIFFTEFHGCIQPFLAVRVSAPGLFSGHFYGKCDGSPRRFLSSTFSLSEKTLFNVFLDPQYFRGLVVAAARPTHPPNSYSSLDWDAHYCCCLEISLRCIQNL